MNGQVMRLLLVFSMLVVGACLLVGVAPVPTPPAVEVTIGRSSQGRPINALRVGDGPRKFVLVGNTHGGPEANTANLVAQLADYFRAHPDEVPTAVRLYVIPTINPDGLALGTRFNGRGVDLNRNMDTSADMCPENDWRVHVQGAYGVESDTGGAYPESEVESQVVRDFLLDAAGAIFYHSAGGDVFPAFCDHGASIRLAQRYAGATGYRYDRYWPNYLITGGMHDWAGGLGIAAITPELSTGIDPDYAQNLAGVQAILRDADVLLPLPEDHVEAGVLVPALIWRFWRAHGGSERFGPPLMRAEADGGGVQQVFERVVVKVRPDQADRSFSVEAVALGHDWLVGRQVVAGVPAPNARFFPETGHTLRDAFASYWDRGGVRVFGYPISEEFLSMASDGERRVVQVFERAVFAYYPEDGSVRLEPLGWWALLRQRLRGPTLLQQIR